MTTESHFRKLENMMHSAPFVQFTEAKVTIGLGEATILMPVKRDMFHAAHAMHGAMYFLGLDNAAFFAANSYVDDVFVLTTSFTTYITRPVSSGQVRAEGRVVNQNRSQFIAEAVMYNDEDREIARANGIFVRSKIPLNSDIGYA